MTLPVNNAALLGLSTIPTIDVTSILAQPGRLFASLNNGLTSSADGGATWVPEVQVLPPTGTQQVFLMTSAPGAPQNILAASSQPLFKSADGGGTWSQVVTGVPANSSASNLLFAASNPAVAYGAFNSTGLGPTAYRGVYKSMDSGNSWAPVNTNLAASPILLLAVDPTNANTLYGSGASSLLKSVDGGVTWSVLTWDSTGSSGAPNALTIDPLHPNILYAAGSQRAACVRY